MCMNEFIKRLYDFMGIYKIFWSQNSDYRYLPIFTDILPIFTDILPIFYRYFFKNSCTSARAPQSRFFGGKIGFFRFFGEKSAILPIFPRFFLWSIFPLIFLLGASRKPIFRRNIGRKNRFFVPWLQQLCPYRHAYLSIYQVLSRQSMCILCSVHISYSRIIIVIR